MKIGDKHKQDGQNYVVKDSTLDSGLCGGCDLYSTSCFHSGVCPLAGKHIFKKVNDKLKRYSVVFTSSKGVMRKDTIEAKSLLLAFFQIPAIIPDGFNNISIKEIK